MSIRSLFHGVFLFVLFVLGSHQSTWAGLHTDGLDKRNERRLFLDAAGHSLTEETLCDPSLYFSSG